MFKKLKELYYKWRTRDLVASSCVYVVVYKPELNDETYQRVVIDSIHTTFNGAKRYLIKNHEATMDTFSIMKFGLWTR